MIKDDLAGVNQPAADVPVDDGWQEQFAGAEDAGEDAPKVGGQTIPSFPYYFIKGISGKAGFTKKKQSPVIRPGMQIVNGPDGTIGETVFDDLYLLINRTTQVEGVEVPKDAEEYAEQVKKNLKKLNKIARVGKFGQAHPLNGSKTALETYAKQFESFPLSVVEIRESTETYEGNTRTRNRIIWESLRAVDDPASSKKAKPGTTAGQEAEAAIEAANKAAANKAGKDGRTAGSVTRKGLGD